MKQIIHIQVGQAGVQIGNSTWEVFCDEHGISPEGKAQEDNNNEANFQELPNGRMIPRTLFLDLQPTVVDQIKVGKYKDLFCRSSLLSDKEDAANNFCRGHYTIGRRISDTALDQIRKISEACNSLEGFIMTHSVGGGTGAGLGTLLLEKLSVDYGKTPKFTNTVYPSPRYETSVLQTYNSVLATHNLLDHTDMTIMYDNQSIYKLLSGKGGIESPYYSDVNEIVAKNISSLTSSLRFEGLMNENMSGLVTNFTPYPRIHFGLCSSSLPENQNRRENQTVSGMTRETFNKRSFLASIDPTGGKYMSSLLFYRGDVLPWETVEAVQRLRSPDILFADWAPTCFKVCINSKKVHGSGLRSLSMIGNTTAVADICFRLDHKFDLMYGKRAFVYWMVGDAMQQGEFSEAREDLACLEKDYQECSMATPVEQYGL